MSMNDENIINFLKQLDEYVPKENAEAKFAASGEVTLYANKEGYLRMAAELMKCAYAETYPDASLHYLFDKDSEFGIDNLAVDEEQLKFFSS
jgi:hypothetical protein